MVPVIYFEESTDSHAKDYYEALMSSGLNNDCDLKENECERLTEVLRPLIRGSIPIGDEEPSPVNSIIYDTSRDILFTCSIYGVKIWDTNGGNWKLSSTIETHEFESIINIEYDVRSQRLICVIVNDKASDGSSIQIFDHSESDQKWHCTYVRNVEMNVNCVAYDTDRHWIFAGSEKCSSDSITVIRIGIYHEEIDDWVWDKDNDLRSHIDDILEILYDGESGSTPLISSSADNTVKFWKIKRGKKQTYLVSDTIRCPGKPLRLTYDSVNASLFTMNLKYDSEDLNDFEYTILFWKYDKNTDAWAVHFKLEDPHGFPLFDFIYDHISQRIVTSNASGIIDVWDKDIHGIGWNNRFTLKGGHRSPVCLAYHEPTKQIVSGDVDGLLKSWDLSRIEFFDN